MIKFSSFENGGAKNWFEAEKHALTLHVSKRKCTFICNSFLKSTNNIAPTP